MTNSYKLLALATLLSRTSALDAATKQRQLRPNNKEASTRELAMSLDSTVSFILNQQDPNESETTHSKTRGSTKSSKSSGWSSGSKGSKAQLEERVDTLEKELKELEEIVKFHPSRATCLDDAARYVVPTMVYKILRAQYNIILTHSFIL